jgi:hypothetical protein
MQRVQESETLCRKGGTSRSDNAPLASRACAGAKLACGATLSATREFVGLVRVLNLLVVPPFLRRGNLWGLCGCLTCLWRHPFCDAGICGACAGAQLACGASLSATREFVGLARVLNLLVVPAILRRGILRGSRGCLVHTFERPVLFRGIKLQTGEAEFACVK